MSFIETFINGKILWGPITLIISFILFVYISVKTRFVQVRCFSRAVRTLFDKKNNSGKIFLRLQAFFTSLAGSLGTGNISGVLVALLSGGPGAVFWMWVSAFFGMAVKYAEIMLGLEFSVSYNGKKIGGPMYYMEKGLGRNGKHFALIFSAGTVLVSLGMGNIVQANAIISSVETFADNRIIIKILFSILLSFLVYSILSGGMKLTGIISSKIVPFMSILYIGFCVAVIIKYINLFPLIIKEIFFSAFNMNSAVGAINGMAFKKTLSTGINKGIFSNEAGLGTSAMVHCELIENDNEKEAFLGMLEVFVDTVVICSLTAFTLLISQKAGSICFDDSFSCIISNMFSCIVPMKISAIFVNLSIILFAFSSVLPWGCYGQTAVNYLFGDNKTDRYRIIFSLCTFVGSLIKLKSAWIISDMFNAFMFIPNMIAVFILLNKQKNNKKCEFYK